MTDETQAILDELARLRGLGEAYYDHGGTLRNFSVAARRAILQALGVPLDDADTLRSLVELERRATMSSRAATKALCYQPSALDRKKCWGLSVQLYTLRSARDWGIGDFADLRELIERAAPLGCDVIGLNPLHALFVANPAHASPYSPSNRLLLNLLYIDVEGVPEFASCDEAQKLCSDPSFQSALAALRATDNVMYEQVAALKLAALRLLHDHFAARETTRQSERARAFAEFIAARGESLRRHAVFEVLDRHFRERQIYGWRNWPHEFHNPESQEVREFADAHRHDVEFFIYAQWIAAEQLAALQRLARERGMAIGLYGDLAVGANPDGSEVWSNPKLYVCDVSVGAPPDPLALSGQDWGIPPLDPHELRAQQLRPFAELLRANMQHVAALRIDHVMSLFRLWWVPRGFGATEGVYVHYPLDELVAAVADESVASRCLVIGEDLGTVPDEMRRAMETSRLYHYKVLLFEKFDGRFKTPNEYPRYSVATAATHDLPPLKAWWQSDDLTLRDRLGLYPSVDTAHRLHAERQADRVALLRALNDAGLWRWQSYEPVPEFSLALARAIQLYLAKTDARLVLVQLEDLIGMTDPVNVPGTNTEHANWQRKLPLTTDDILGREDVREVLKALCIARAGGDPNA